MPRILLPLLLAAAAHAASPVATISSSQPFQLRGATVNPKGVPSWPVLAGDAITAGAVPAELEFRDGSRVVLAKATRVVIEQQDSRLRVRLTKGAVTFRLKPGSRVAVAALKLKPVPADYLGGSLYVFKDSAYITLDAAPATSSGPPATPVQITPFNLGYLAGLRQYEGQPGQTPPQPPPAHIGGDAGPLQSMSPTRP